MKVRTVLKKLLFIFFIFFNFSTLILADNTTVVMSNISDQEISATIQFDIKPYKSNETLSDPQRNGDMIPLIKKSFLFLSESQRLDIQIEKIQTTPINQQMHVVEDIPIGSDFIPVDQLTSVKSAFEMKCIGKLGRHYVHQLQVDPLVNNDKNPRSLISSLKLRISGLSISQIQNDILSHEQFISTRSTNQRKSLQKSIKKSDSNQNDRLKIMIPRDGIYVLPQPMIEEVGFDLRQIDPHYLKITNRKKEIPIRIVGEDDGRLDYNDVIEFWGEALWDETSDEKHLDIYARQNVYWLEIGEKPGLRMGQIEGRIDEDNPQNRVYSNSFPYTQHVEQDAYFHRLAYATHVEDADHWLYSNPIVGGEKRDFGFQVSNPDLYSTQLSTIQFKLRGQVRDEKIHNFEVYINNRVIGTGSWTGINEILFESEAFSSSYLKKGYNTVSIINRSTEGELCQLILDWFELTYPRLFEPVNDKLQFQAPRYSLGKVVAFEIEDFSSQPIEIYKNGSIRIFNPEIIPFTDTLDVTTYEVQFQDYISDESTQYIALTPDQKMVPDSVAFVEAGHLRSSEMGADYIMITASDSLGEDVLQELVEFRESEGLDVEIVPLENIYYEFSEGIANPTGIRDFIRYAKNNWNPSPRFVLLVGDGIINNRASQASGNFIPTPLYQTIQFGAAATDHWYTLLDDDIYPDIAIGRLPVRTKAELQLIISKIINYETTPRAPWMNQYLLIGAGGYGDVFKFQSEEIIEEIFHPRYQPKRLYLFGDISDPDVGGTEDLLRYFRDGVSMVNFRGHGGGAIWSDGGLLDMDDIELIENKNKLPIITSMTCFTADFSSSKQSIGEALLYQEEGGTAAFWGSTGLGWVWNDYYMLQFLYTILNSNTISTLGEMIMHAKQNYLMTYGGDLPLSEAHQYVLLGDPALSVHLPDNSIDFDLSNRSVEKNQTINIQGVMPSSPLTVQADIINKKGYSFNTKVINIPTDVWQSSITLPNTFDGNTGGVRIYAWDTNSGYHASGFEPFDIGKAYFSNEQMEPEMPTSRDSIRFLLKVEDDNPTTSVWCTILEPFVDSLSMKMSNESQTYESERAIGPISPALDLVYSFGSLNSLGEISRGDTLRYRIPRLSDLIPLLVQTGGNNQVQLEATIMNAGEEPVNDVMVQFKDRSGFIGADTLSIPSYGQGIARSPYYSASGKMDFEITVNPDSTLPENTLSNNNLTQSVEMINFNVTMDDGTLSGRYTPGPVGLLNELICNIPANTIEKTVLKIERYHIESPWLTFEAPVHPEHTFHINLVNFTDQTILKNNAEIHFYLNDEEVNTTLKPYRWNQNANAWIVCEFAVNDSIVVVQTNQLGVFTLMESNDQKPPSIQFQIDNQSLTNGSYVPRNPSFSLILQDESGIDTRNEAINIFLDDQLFNPSQLILPDSVKDSRHISIAFRPEITVGDHQIYAVAQDIHGNSVQSGITWFQVSYDFDIQFLGNHPNPFDKETVFVYVLTDVAEYLSLKIYTVSGRLIRTFDDYSLTSADYHEVIWDGTDEWGEKVSNGVYFFRLKGKNPRGNREITGKIAIIR